MYDFVFQQYEKRATLSGSPLCVAYAKVILVCLNSLASLSAASCVAVASARISASTYRININAVAVNSSTLLSLVTARSERNSYDSCEYKC